MPSIGIKRKKKGEEENPTADGAETEEGASQEEGEEGKKGKKKKKEKGKGGGKTKIITWILIIVLVAAALFAGGVLMTKILLPSIVKGMYNDIGNMQGNNGEGDLPEQEVEMESLELVATHPLDEMMIQLAADELGVRPMLVMNMAIGFTNKKDAEKFEEKKLEIQDIVLSTLMSKTKDELSTQNDIEALKRVLANKISKLFSEKNQIQIVISKFLIQ